MSKKNSPAPAAFGFEDRDHDHGSTPKFLPHGVQERWSMLTVAVADLALIVGFFGEKIFDLPPSIALACYPLSYLAGGYDVAREALSAQLRGKFDIEQSAITGKRARRSVSPGSLPAILFLLSSSAHTSSS